MTITETELGKGLILSDGLRIVPEDSCNWGVFRDGDMLDFSDALVELLDEYAPRP
ncbi:hypothetical protein [uncultured Rhodospira sp.]|uniref:hypothetical protein n=1 Tax=uncultured Rhodospira sp. TaxID=1936189 RepID=UPI00263A1E0A|nr:hypothetical protein [uncultured Rhodospira sp.]